MVVGEGGNWNRSMGEDEAVLIAMGWLMMTAGGGGGDSVVVVAVIAAMVCDEVEYQNDKDAK